MRYSTLFSTKDLIEIGTKLKSSKESYENAMNKLTGKGSIIKKIENLKELGVKTQKSQDIKILEELEDE